MDVFLTGAAGFVGLEVSRALVERGCTVHALVRSDTSAEALGGLQPHLQVIRGDLESPDQWRAELEKIHPEMCVHLAWITTPGVYLKSPVNIDLVASSLRLAEILRSAGCKTVVGAGTCFEYDTDLRTLSETTPVRPRTLYSASKLALHTILDQFCKLNSMRFVWPRLFYLYGPREHERRLVPTLIRSFRRGEPVRMTSGDKVRDYLHVSDVASAVCATAMSDLTGAVNIGSGRPVTLRELTDKIAVMVGAANTAQFDALPADPADPAYVLADNLRLLATGWKPRYTLEAGLEQTAEWWKGQR